MTSTPPSRRASARTSFRFRVAGVMLGLVVLTPAFAKQGDRAQPMQVKARHFEGFQKPNSVSTVQGDVVITQGTLRATGDQAKVFLGADTQISHVLITGAPAHIQQVDDNGNLMQGHAARIDYDSIHGIAVLSGQAEVTQQGRGTAHGDKLTYNTQTSQMTGESAGDGMVHMTFLPKPKGPPEPQGASGPARSGSAAPAASSSVPAHQVRR
ncbi:MAG: lipopolysaccharide transport periplasmic protein LptA [Rhodanobacter sp.]